MSLDVFYYTTIGMRSNKNSWKEFLEQKKFYFPEEITEATAAVELLIMGRFHTELENILKDDSVPDKVKLRICDYFTKNNCFEHAAIVTETLKTLHLNHFRQLNNI